MQYYYLDRICDLAKALKGIPNTGKPNPSETDDKTSLFTDVFPFCYRYGIGVYSGDLSKNGKPVDLLDHIGNYAYIRANGPAIIDPAGGGCVPDINVKWPLVLVCWVDDLDISKVEYWVTNLLLQQSPIVIDSVTIDPFEALRMERDLVTPEGERFPNLKNRALVRYELTLKERRAIQQADCAPLDFCKSERQCC